MVHFQNLLDVTGANMHTIMSFTNPTWRDEKHRSGRRYMLISLAKELSIPYVQSRLQNVAGIHTEQVELIKKFVGVSSTGIISK